MILSGKPAESPIAERPEIPGSDAIKLATAGHIMVFAGGQFDRDNRQLVSASQAADAFLAVDKGLEHSLALNIVPDMLLGDFDSVDPELLQDSRITGVARQSYPPVKDCSDLEIALCWLATQSPQLVTLVGVSGGRTDHMLFNWLLPVLRDWPFSIDLIDEAVHAHVVTPDRTLEFSTWQTDTDACASDVYPAGAGSLFSVLALDRCSGLTINGVEYPLQAAALERGSTLGLSNRISSDKACVSLQAGKCIVMRILDERTDEQSD